MSPKLSLRLGQMRTSRSDRSPCRPTGLFGLTAFRIFLTLATLNY